jgi:hypothetical protein
MYEIRPNLDGIDSDALKIGQIDWTGMYVIDTIQL